MIKTTSPKRINQLYSKLIFVGQNEVIPAKQIHCLNLLTEPQPNIPK